MKIHFQFIINMREISLISIELLGVVYFYERDIQKKKKQIIDFSPMKTNIH